MSWELWLTEDRGQVAHPRGPLFSPIIPVPSDVFQHNSQRSLTGQGVEARPPESRGKWSIVLPLKPMGSSALHSARPPGVYSPRLWFKSSWCLSAHHGPLGRCL